MNDQENNVTITVMGKTYKVKCPSDHIDELRSSAAYLDEKMREVAQSSKVISIDRIGVIAALNITHELITQKNQNNQYIDQVGKRIENLHSKIEEALAIG